MIKTIEERKCDFCKAPKATLFSATEEQLVAICAECASFIVANSGIEPHMVQILVKDSVPANDSRPVLIFYVDHAGNKDSCVASHDVDISGVNRWIVEGVDGWDMENSFDYDCVEAWMRY